MIHFNMDPKVIRYGGRKAPIITRDELELLIKAAVPYDPESSDFTDPLEGLLNKAFVEDDPSPLAKAIKDLEKVYFSFEDVCYDGIKVSAAGIPYFWAMAYGECDCPVGFMIYFDGKDFRGYIPTYGNSFNPKTKSAFGYEGDSGKNYTGTYSYVEDGVAKAITVRNEDEFEEFCYHTLSDIAPCEEACFEAFNARVEAVGSMTHEQVIAAAKKLEARATKLLED